MTNPRQDGAFPQLGQRVRVIDGPFTDYDGVVVLLHEDRRMARVVISFFGRDTTVELPFSQLEALTHSDPPPPHS
jgi:transcriptional antiterminator NusG